MPKKKECRYNGKHKFETEEAQLEHEKKCPDKKKRTDLKECPYSNRHIVNTKQYETHIKKCKFKPKEKKEIPANANNNPNDNNNNKEKNKIESKNDEWNNTSDTWGNDDLNDSQKEDNSKKEETFNFNVKDDNDVFEEEDFIFKQAYI